MASVKECLVRQVEKYYQEEELKVETSLVYLTRDVIKCKKEYSKYIKEQGLTFALFLF
jgi:hypothetical protein